MTRRLKREHGRIMSVETKVRGDALSEDAAAGASTLVVGDTADFDEDGGWLVINDQVVEYLEADDDEGIITLAEGLAAPGDEGDAVHVWSTLYDEVVDYQEALVELDGEYDNPEPVVAEVAEGVGDLPEGDRGVAGESCTLLRVSDDEWEVVGVGGRGRKSRGLRFEADDVYFLTVGDVTAGTVTFPLSHRPVDESLVAFWEGLFQEPTEYTIDYTARTITWPLAGFEEAGDRLSVHYAYRKGLDRTQFYINDEFNRTTLGSATRMPSGEELAWETAGGTWVPEDGTLYVQTVTRDTTVCVIDSGHADGDVTISIIGGSGGAGRALAFRVSDDLASGFGIEMDGRVAYDPGYGTTTDDTTVVNLGVEFLPGDELRVRMAGSSLTFFKNGVQVGQATDTRNQAATKHGFAANVGGSASNGFDSFWMTGTGR